VDDKPKSIAYIEYMQTLIATPVARFKFALHKYCGKRVVWRRRSPPQASLAISILFLGGISEL
jgi:hypothetical protein